MTDVKRAGRGVLSISAAKLYFIVAGYAVQLALPRLLDGPEQFGLYASVMSPVSILTNVLIAATLQSVSKRVSETPGQAQALLREGLTLQLGVGAVLASLALLCAEPLAVRVFADPLMAPLLRVSAVVLASYSVYAVLVGALNGQQLFAKQAALDMTYTTLRTIGIIGAAALGFGVLGAVGGFAAATASVLCVALVLVGTGSSQAPLDRERLRPWASLLAQLWLYQLCLNLMMQVDVSVLKATVASMAQAAGALEVEAAATASRYVGMYRAAQTFAFVPYQLILSVTFVVFPLVSSAVTAGDAETTRNYVRGAMRFSLLVLLAIAAPVSGAAGGVMHLAYPNDYLGGAAALEVLAPGMVAFAMFAIGATILSGAGLPTVAAKIAAVGAVLVVGCNLAFLHAAGVGPNTARAAAAGTSCGMVFALIAVGLTVHRRFGAFLPMLSTLRVLAAGGASWAVARALPSDSPLKALVALIGGGIAYLIALAVLREITQAELAIVRRVLKR